MDAINIFGVVATAWMIIVAFIAIWVDKNSSGRTVKKARVFSEIFWTILTVVAIWWIIGFEEYGINLFCISSILFSVVRLSQYSWYIGPLKSYRQRRVERLRARWQTELNDLHMWQENATGHRSEYFDLEQAERIQYLEDKLKNVTA